MCYSLYIFNDKHEIQGFFRPPPPFFLIACQEILDKSAPPPPTLSYNTSKIGY